MIQTLGYYEEDTRNTINDPEASERKKITAHLISAAILELKILIEEYERD